MKKKKSKEPNVLVTAEKKVSIDTKKMSGVIGDVMIVFEKHKLSPRDGIWCMARILQEMMEN